MRILFIKLLLAHIKKRALVYCLMNVETTHCITFLTSIRVSMSLALELSKSGMRSYCRQRQVVLYDRRDEGVEKGEEVTIMANGTRANQPYPGVGEEETSGNPHDIYSRGDSGKRL